MPRRDKLFQSESWILRKSKYILWFFVALALWAGALAFAISDYLPSLTRHIDQGDIDLTAKLGDTFGTISALMAAFAAVGAILALSEQRSAVRRQMFVATFVGMMDRLQQTVQDTDYSVVQRITRDDGLIDERLVVTQSGQNAFFEIAQELRVFIQDRKVKGMPRAAFEGLVIGLYESFYDDYKDALGHYFRQMYHILRFIDDSVEGGQRQIREAVKSFVHQLSTIVVSL